jgi:peptidoglycan-associated lipoprotein
MKQNARVSTSVGTITPMVMIVPLVIFMASCSTKLVKTQPVAQAEPQVQMTPDRSAEVAAANEAAEKVFVNEMIHFPFDSADLSNQARQILSSKADYLRSNPDVTMTVEGYCDERGTNAYNLALGERRAESVKTFLVDMGIRTDRLKTMSYGEERPVVKGHNETAWAQNRRAEFVID